MRRTVSNRVTLLMVAMVLGTVAALTASGAFAQSPPNPPSRFAGTVKVNGQNAAAGTTVEARVGAASCGITTVFLASGEARYVLDSPEGNAQTAPGCGSDGSNVTFLVGGVVAAESAPWRNYTLNVLNLTATTVTATPTKPATPAAPVAGNAMAPAGGSMAWAWVLVVGVPLLLGAGAVGLRSRVVARR